MSRQQAHMRLRRRSQAPVRVAIDLLNERSFLGIRPLRRHCAAARGVAPSAATPASLSAHASTTQHPAAAPARARGARYGRLSPYRSAERELCEARVPARRGGDSLSRALAWRAYRLAAVVLGRRTGDVGRTRLLDAQAPGPVLLLCRAGGPQTRVPGAVSAAAWAACGYAARCSCRAAASSRAELRLVASARHGCSTRRTLSGGAVYRRAAGRRPCAAVVVRAAEAQRRRKAAVNCCVRLRLGAPPDRDATAASVGDRVPGASAVAHPRRRRARRPC